MTASLALSRCCCCCMWHLQKSERCGGSHTRSLRWSQCLARPSICKLRACSLVTCAAKTQFRSTDIDLPHNERVAATGSAGPIDNNCDLETTSSLELRLGLQFEAMSNRCALICGQNLLAAIIYSLLQLFLWLFSSLAWLIVPIARFWQSENQSETQELI